MTSVVLYPSFAFEWQCPQCAHVNTHKGRQRLAEGEEEVRDAAAQELAEMTGNDPESFVALVLPHQVWCSACEGQFDAEPPSDIAEDDGCSGL